MSKCSIFAENFYIDISRYSFLTLFYTQLKKTFNAFTGFWADPAKKYSQYSLRILKQPSPVPNTLKGFSTDPWKISTPPKGSIQTLPPFHFVFPPFFLLTVSHLTLNQPGSEMSLNYRGPFGFDLAFTRCKLTSPGIWGIFIECCGFGNLPRTVRQH